MQFLLYIQIEAINCCIIITNGIVSKNDPKNKINSEEFQYGLEEEKELQPDPELEAEKERTRQLRDIIILIVKIVSLGGLLVAAIISGDMKSIIAVIVGSIVVTGVNFGILHALDGE